MPRQTSQTDRPDVPDEYPDPDWTPKQMENWDAHGAAEYAELETEIGREFFRRIWRPKKRNDGLLEREHVKLGTPEDYVCTNVDDVFDPWGNMTSVMMREISVPSDEKERLGEAVDDIVQAKLTVLADRNPDAARRLLAETERVGQLYGVIE